METKLGRATVGHTDVTRGILDASTTHLERAKKMKFPALPPAEFISFRDMHAFRSRAAQNLLRLSEGNFDQVNTFQVNVGKKYPATCYLFLSLNEGKLHILQSGTVIKDVYTKADDAERDRLGSQTVQQHGDYVQVGCSMYRVVVKGDYSDVGYLEYIGSI